MRSAALQKAVKADEKAKILTNLPDDKVINTDDEAHELTAELENRVRLETVNFLHSKSAREIFPMHVIVVLDASSPETIRLAKEASPFMVIKPFDTVRHVFNQLKLHFKLGGVFDNSAEFACKFEEQMAYRDYHESPPPDAGRFSFVGYHNQRHRASAFDVDGYKFYSFESHDPSQFGTSTDNRIVIHVLQPPLDLNANVEAESSRATTGALDSVYTDVDGWSASQLLACLLYTSPSPRD